MEITIFWFWFWIALSVFGGFFFGVFLMCLCQISSNSERRMAKVLEKKTPIKANDANNEIAF